MTDTLKRQQIILLHGTSAFTQEHVTNMGIAAGELIIEQGLSGDTKLHTIDKNSNLTSFITEEKINESFTSVNKTIEGINQAIDGDGGLIERMDTVETSASTNAAAILVLQEAIGLSGETTGGSTSGIANRLVSIEEVLSGTSGNNGLIKQVSGNTSVIETHTQNLLDVNADLAQLSGETYSLFGEAKTVVSGETGDDALIIVTPSTDPTDNHVTYTISANNIAKQSILEQYTQAVDGLIGDDSGKSVREIATLVLTEELIAAKYVKLPSKPEDATSENTHSASELPESKIENENIKYVLFDSNYYEWRNDSLDSLEEIAEWIQNHPDDAAAMNADIQDAKQRIEQIEQGYISDVNVVNKEINKIDVTRTDHSIALNFDEMVINGGTY